MYNGYEDDPELQAVLEESWRDYNASHSEDAALARALSVDEPYVRAADQTIFGALYGNRPITQAEILENKARAQSYQAELNADHAQREAAEYATKRVNRKKNMLYELATKIENYAKTLKSEITALNPIDKKGNIIFLNPLNPKHKQQLDEIETKTIVIQTKINKYNALAQDIRQWADRNASNNLKYKSDELISYANLPEVDVDKYDDFIDVSVDVADEDYYSSGGRRKKQRKSRAKRGTKKQRKSRKSRR